MNEPEFPSPVTRDDLIQVEHELYTLILRERRRQLVGDFDHRVEEHLGEGATWVNVEEEYHPPIDESVALVLGSQMKKHASGFAGANLSAPARWKRVPVGQCHQRAADYVTGFCDGGTLLEVPSVLSTWMHNGHRHVRVTVRTEHEESAHDYQKALVDSARGPLNPWRRRVLEVKPAAGGISFESRSLASLDPGPLWFPDEISNVITSNVTNAIDNLATLRGAGLGSNRGLLIAGPPGVGKTALCRRAALELEGRATVVLVSSQVGQWLISRLYEELQYLAPAVVFLEDLDLLVGDREERSAREGLIDFLTVLEGLMTRHHEVITVATTNDPEAIDAAVTRAGRFDVVLDIGPPDGVARRHIIEHYLENLDVDEGIDYDVIVARTDGATGADLREIVRRSFLTTAESRVTTAALLAAVESLAAGMLREPVTQNATERVGQPTEAGQYL